MHTIITAAVKDAGTIRSLAETTWWPTYTGLLQPEQISYMLDFFYSIENLEHQIKTREQNFLLLLEEGKAVAFAGYSVYENDVNTYKLHKLYCLPQTQGKGYGRILIDSVSGIAADNGASKLLLNVKRDNPAMAFYNKMGFTITAEVDIPLGPYWLHDYVMEKPLP